MRVLPGPRWSEGLGQGTGITCGAGGSADPLLPPASPALGAPGQGWNPEYMFLQVQGASALWRTTRPEGGPPPCSVTKATEKPGAQGLTPKGCPRSRLRPGSGNRPDPACPEAT